MENYGEKPHPKTKPTSNSDLMSSAKVLADAAKSAYSKDSDKIDKAKVAGAAADFIGAAKHYGKFEDKNFGKYVDKAESYLHNYHSSSSAVPSHAPGGNVPAGHPPEAGAGDGYGGGKPQGGHSSAGGAGGYGEYIKLAQGLLKKDDHGNGGGGGGSSGGSGDYIKLAQGLFNKKH